MWWSYMATLVFINLNTLLLFTCFLFVRHFLFCQTFDNSRFNTQGFTRICHYSAQFWLLLSQPTSPPIRRGNILAPPPKSEQYGGDWFLCPPNVALLTLCHRSSMLHFVSARSHHTVRLFVHVVVVPVVKCNSHNWSNDGILLRCVKNTLEPPQNFRNVNIPTPTSGMYSTQNMFTLTYLTQL